MDETLDTFLQLCKALSQHPQRGELVLATLVAGGSGAAGGRAWIDPQGGIHGAVTLGGCADHQLRAAAQQVLATGQPTRIEVQLGSGEAYEFGMTCSARATVQLQRHRPDHPLWEKLAHKRRQAQTITLKTPLTGGQTEWWANRRGHDQTSERRFVSGEVFYEVIAAPTQLLIVGEGPISRPLAELGRTLGLQPRILTQLPQTPLGEFCAVVIVSHQYDQEVDALRLALASPARYIGLVASRRRGAAVLDFLEQTGSAPKALGRVHTPAGLRLGQPSPAGIALSILAQVVQTFWNGDGQALGRTLDPRPVSGQRH